jgi:hypothetical protein
VNAFTTIVAIATWEFHCLSVASLFGAAKIRSCATCVVKIYVSSDATKDSVTPFSAQPSTALFLIGSETTQSGIQSNSTEDPSTTSTSLKSTSQCQVTEVNPKGGDDLK